MSLERLGDATEGGAAAGDETPRSRRDLLRISATAAVASLLGILGTSAGAGAKNGETLRAGERAGASRSTVLESSKGTAFHGKASSGSGIGLKGEATSGKGESVGVQGRSRSPDAVAGQFAAEGGGTGVEAVAGGRGVALRTRGRVQLTERSGIASVSGGAEFVIPVAGGLTEGSLVLATLQDHFPNVHVESAAVLDAGEGLIVVRLSQALPEPGRVGWVVLD